MLRALLEQNKIVGKKYKDAYTCLREEMPKYGEKFELSVTSNFIILTVKRALSDDERFEYEGNIDEILEQNGLGMVSVKHSVVTAKRTTEFII